MNVSFRIPLNKCKILFGERYSLKAVKILNWEYWLVTDVSILKFTLDSLENIVGKAKTAGYALLFFSPFSNKPVFYISAVKIFRIFYGIKRNCT